VGAVAAVSVACRAPGSAVAEWAAAALAGAAGAAAIGVAAALAGVAAALEIGVVATGAVVIGMAASGAATTGAIITIMDLLISSSSAASAFPLGGAGVGAGAIRMDTMVTVTRTITTATDMATTAMDMVGATEMITISPVTGTAIAADQGSLNCSGGSPVLAIIAALLTGSWGLRHGEQFELTSATMEM
jgi:hypothetical protein